MAIRPGTTLTMRDTTAPRSGVNQLGRWFVTGLTQRGPVVPTSVFSMAEYLRVFGAREGFTRLHDAAETFFREGGGELIVARVLGVGAAGSTVTLLDGSAGASLVATSKSAGAWANGLNIEVAAGGTSGTFTLRVTHDSDAAIDERSPELVDPHAAVAWAQASSRHVVLTLGASALDPAVGTFDFTGGSDGAAVVEDDWTAAAARIPAAMGPGQVSAPGRTTTAAHLALLAHAASTNRFALLDTPDSASESTVLAAGTALRGGANARYGMLLGPWVTVPGLSVGTLRTVPASALAAGVIARNDGTGMSPNTPAAGVNGQARFAVDVARSFTEQQRSDLYQNGGVNAIAVIRGSVRVYGFRTLVDPASLPGWVNAANVRMLMAIAEQADEIGEAFVLREIDRHGHLLKEYEGALRGMLAPYWAAGSLYGDDSDEAFGVETGPAVNTPESIAANELRAVISVRMAPFAELVSIEIVKVGVSDAVA